MRTALTMIAVLGTGCVAGALPPSQTEIGPTMVARSGRTETGMRVTSGAHWASSTAKNPRFDVGVGYVVERTGDAPDEHVASTEEALGTGGGVETAPRDDEDPLRIGQGVYLDLARRVAAGPSHRAWLGFRGQALWSGLEQHPDLGIGARLSWELYSIGSGAGGFSDRCGGGVGVAAGTTAVGGYVEAGYRVSPDGVAELVSTAGVSIRLPFLAGVAFNLCG